MRNEESGRAKQKIWSCKIGEADFDQHGQDAPMRRAVKEAFLEVTGSEPLFIFSGWGAELTEPERAIVENREPLPSPETSASRPQRGDDLCAQSDHYCVDGACTACGRTEAELATAEAPTPPPRDEQPSPSERGITLSPEERARESGYVAGVKVGWNCGITEDTERYKQIITGHTVLASERKRT